MMHVRPALARGHAQHGWLDSHHTFSFADYYDPAYMGFRALRVINDDRVAPGQGFGTHPHRDMEIISYVLEGHLAHRDSMGTGSTIAPGDLQRMSAGTGVTHSEFNPSQSEPVHFLQIWLMPASRGAPPSYEQKTFVPEDKRGRLRLVASPDARDGSLTIHCDTAVYSGFFDKGESADLRISPGRHVWLQVARGRIRANGQDLNVGDGAALSDESSLRLDHGDGAEVIVFDLA